MKWKKLQHSKEFVGHQVNTASTIRMFKKLFTAPTYTLTWWSMRIFSTKAGSCLDINSMHRSLQFVRNESNSPIPFSMCCLKLIESLLWIVNFCVIYIRSIRSCRFLWSSNGTINTISICSTHTCIIWWWHDISRTHSQCLCIALWLVV